MENMEKEERFQKILKRIDSAMLHAEALKKDVHDADIDLALGHLKRAQEMIYSIYYATHHEGKKAEQLTLF